MEPEERAARAIAGIYGPAFDECPKDRADLRAKYRRGEVSDINMPTQSDHLEAAALALREAKDKT